MPFAVNTMCLGGRYTLIAKLGAGGQGEVWRARDHARGDEVALKILNPELAKNPSAWAALQREYAVVARLRHPLILKVFAPERDEAMVALPMELAPGGDLRRLRGVSYLEIGPVLLEVAEALAHAHALGVVHRDLKPENVLFDSRGHVRLADFGAVGITPSATEVGTGSDSSSTELNRIGLSPFSASPEQLRGEPPAISDDVYGLGALAYELLSGRPPYYPRFELKRAIEEPVPPVQPAHQTPERLTVLVMSMLNKSPRRRPGSMREVIDALDATLNDTLTFETAAPVFAPASSTASPVGAAIAAHPIEAPVNTLSASVDRGVDASIVVPSATTWLPPATEQPPPPPVELATPTDGPLALAEQELPAEPIAIELAAAAAQAPPSQPIPLRASSPPQRARRAMEEPPRRTPEAARTSSAASARLPEPWRRAIEGGSMRGPESRAAFASEGDAAVAYESPPLAVKRATDGSAPSPAGAPAEPPPARAYARAQPELRTLWGDIKIERMPNLMRLEPQRSSKWPWVFLVGLAAAAAVFFFSMPRDAGRSLPALRWPSQADLRATMQNIKDTSRRIASAAASAVSSALPGDTTRHPAGAQTDAGAIAKTAQDGSRAGRNGASDTGTAAGTLAVPTSGASAATQSRGATVAVASGSAPNAKHSHPSVVQNAATPLNADDQKALNAELDSGERALQAGNRPVAHRAFELAYSIDPGNLIAERGLQRASVLDGVLPLLADGLKAEAARSYSRAAQDYGQALALDPNNASARAGLKRAEAAWGGDTYAEAVSTGFGLLGAGRLEPAREAFTKALAVNARGHDAQEGLERVDAALRSRGLAQLRSRAATLEAQARWGEALQDYNAALRLDPTLSFARQGRARALAHVDLASRSTYERTAAHDETAAYANAPGYASTPAYASTSADDKTVHLALVSDNQTEVEIQEIGSFGTFARHELDLKPGRYVVIGTRAGYRAVRRDVTVAPGRDAQIVSVRCEEPI